MQRPTTASTWKDFAEGINALYQQKGARLHIAYLSLCLMKGLVHFRRVWRVGICLKFKWISNEFPMKPYRFPVKFVLFLLIKQLNEKEHKKREGLSCCQFVARVVCLTGPALLANACSIGQFGFRFFWSLIEIFNLKSILSLSVYDVHCWRAPHNPWPLSPLLMDSLSSAVACFDRGPYTLRGGHLTRFANPILIRSWPS